MNRRAHRLVFDRRRGMRVAAPEHAHAAGKSASGELRATRIALAVAATFSASAFGQAATRPPVVFASQRPAPAYNLPQPYGSTAVRQTDGTFKVRNDRPFVANPQHASQVSWTVNGTSATLDQGQVERLILNWDSFDIAAGYKVHFKQDKDPAKLVSALNRIWSLDPSVILGSLTADREVILVNGNGVYFGRGARVDTGRFVASALGIADAVFEKGLRNVTDASPVFTTAGTDYQPTDLDSAVTVEAGAEIRAAAGGDVLLLAPRVVNQGRIETPGGQAVLAAGDKIYLMSSSDPAQRGLIVAVDPVKTPDGTANDTTLGIVENAASGSYKTVDGATVADATPDATSGLVKRINEIRAESGTVNLVGLTVRQNGQINATTAVKGANGAIYLQAMASTRSLPPSDAPPDASSRGLAIEAGSQVRVGAELGTLQIGAGSVTAVTPDASGAVQIDAEVFNRSRIRGEGAAIAVEAGAVLSAPSGTIELLASRTTEQNPIFYDGQGGVGQADDSRIVIAPGATLSTAGLRDVEVDGARNQGEQRLFRIELADAPVQRSGPLYRSQVFFDLRDASKITSANVSGAAASIGRTAGERSTEGGTIRLETDGALVVGQDAELDVSGGSVHYSQTTIRNTLLAQDGRPVSFRSASASRSVDGVLDAQQSVIAPAYVEGAKGGMLQLNARQLQVAGRLEGSVVEGERQRDGRSARAESSTLAIGQRSGSLYYLDALNLQPGAAPQADPALLADPLHAPLPAAGAAAGLSLDTIAQGGFGRLALRAEHVRQPEFGRLDLGAAGVLDIEARTVDLHGEFVASGGQLSVVTPVAGGDADLTGDGDIRLSASTRLDTAGRWTNDTLATGAEPAGVQKQGGTVRVAAAHSLFAEPGAAIDVSAGAWLTGSGKLDQGKAGSVTLASGTSPLLNPTLAIDGLQMAAFDFAGGGTLSLGTPGLTVAPGGAEPSAGFTLSPEFFSRHGFGTIGVKASGDVRIASGTQLAPRLLNWQLAPDYLRVASTPTIGAAVATPQLLDPALADRAPVNLSLAATRPLLFGGASLQVERGSGIALEPGGALELAATRDLQVGTGGGAPGERASLSAPGGSISMVITGARGGPSIETDPDGFVPEQAIWLGKDADLSVAGVALTRPDSAAPVFAPEFRPAGTTVTPIDQRVTGQVLGGGSITLEARRGYVVAQAGSTLNLDGASAELNVAGLLGPVQVARSAGTLTVSSPEGFVIDSSVSARPPLDAAGQPIADGGRLAVSIGAGGVVDNAFVSKPYPTTPRTLAIGAHDGLPLARDAGPGDDLTRSLGNGTGYVRETLLRDAGFDALALGAGDVLRFDGSMTLTPARSIQLNAPAVTAAPGSQVEIRSASAQLGDGARFRIGAAPDTSAGAAPAAGADTTLRVSAPTIDVYGTSGMRGFTSVALDAGAETTGEIRFTAASPNFVFVESQPARLNFAGELSLIAGQTYATSGTQFTLDGAGPDSRIVVRGAPGGLPERPPLSAFGSMTFQAAEIDQGGVLRQPFGAITLTAARSLRLGDNSVTSVSADGATIPYGSTINLAAWALPPGPQTTDQLPVAKTVSLSAPNIETAATAQVSARGGGDVQAWEFFPGVGGSRDYFDTEGLFAVLPDHALTRALGHSGGQLPADQYARQIVITMPGSGLAPGRYTLLPARFALLAGELPQAAFLVSRASDQGRTVLRSPIVQDDGSVVVTGYLSEAGSRAVGAPGERFVVESPATFFAKSDIRLTSVSELLARRAAGQDRSAPALPVDGGQLNIAVSGEARSTWQAQLDLSADGGRAGLLDVSASRLALVDDAGKAPDGTLTLLADTLEASGAGSVLLGGRRHLDAGSGDDASPVWRIDASGTGSASVDLGAQPLRVEELVVASRDAVTIAAGTTIDASAAPTLGARTWALQGDGALAAVSANPLELRRSPGSFAGGSLQVGAGARLAGQQLMLDATGSMHIDAGATLEADAMDLGARRIDVGTAAVADPTATVLAGSLLATLRSASDIILRGYEGIRFAGSQDWSAATGGGAAAMPARLVLDTPRLHGAAAADGAVAQATLAAQDVELRNTSGRVADPGAAAGQGTLSVLASPPLRHGLTGGLTIGPGSQSWGFDAISLRSGGDIVLKGQGDASAQGPLSLSAARLTAQSGAEQSIAAAGTLRLDTPVEARTLAERVGQGAQVSLSGAQVIQGGAIDLPGGQLSIAARGAPADAAAVRFEPDSSTSVAGFVLPGPQGSEAIGEPGRIDVVADQGRIELLGTLDASTARRADGSAGNGDAGRIALRAAGAGGTLQLSEVQADGSTRRGQILARAGGAPEDQGGALTIDVNRLASADGVAQAASEGGVGGSVSLRVRSGDVTLDRGLTAQRIAIAADAGRLVVGAAPGATVELDARASGGGVVELAASNDLTLGSAVTIDARATGLGAGGGEVLLSSGSGRVHLDAGAAVDTRAADDSGGRIVLRVARGADNASVQLDPLTPAQLRAAEVDIEAVRVYGTTTVNGQPVAVRTIAAGAGDTSGTLGQATVQADSAAFMAAAAPTLGALGVGAADAARVHLRAGVEVRAAGDLNVAGDWALNADRPGGDAGFLTLRAAGNLQVNGSISDGFTGAANTAALNDDPRSWSLRLVGGADLAAARPTAVVDHSAAPGDSGNLSIAGGKLVRTGAGSIELAAGRDVVFGDGAGGYPGQAYVAGRKMQGLADLQNTLFARQSAKPLFTEGGGRLEVTAARDVVAPESVQLMSNWFWRSGLLSTRADEVGLYSSASQLAWWSQFNRFGQSLGSFGGGGLSVSAGRDAVNVQALVPSAGWAADRVAATTTVHEVGGGDLSVVAGRDIVGGQYLVGRGQGRLDAGRRVGAAASNAQLAAPSLALSSGQWRVRARDAVTLGAAFSPTAIPASALDNRASSSGYFYRWSGSDGLRIASSTGTVNLLSGPLSEDQARSLGLDMSTSGALQYFQVLPPNLSVTAVGGDIELLPPGSQPAAVMFPSAEGQLALWAGGSVRLGGPQRGGVLAMADSDPSAWPGTRNPINRSAGTLLTGLIPDTLNDRRVGTTLHADDDEPAFIHADASVEIRGASKGAPTLILPKPVRVSAGDDAIELSLRAQNFRASDVTAVEVGRSYLAGEFGGLSVAGPGAVQLSAGSTVDLGSSAGIVTTGNQRNAGLPAQGASIRVEAATAATLDAKAFDAAYLQGPERGGSSRFQAYRDALRDSVRQTLRAPTLSYEQAWQLFQSFPSSEQLHFARSVLAQEFGQSFLAGPAPNAAEVNDGWRTAFEARKSDVLAAGAAALAAGRALVLPGREVLQGGALAGYLDELRNLDFVDLELTSAVAARAATLADIRRGWQATVAASLGSSPDALAAAAAQDPQDAGVIAYRDALARFSGSLFDSYRDAALARLLATSGAAASQFGRRSLPMRLALFDEGFRAAELAGIGNFAAQPIWPGPSPVLAHVGALEMTQSSVITERGGDITLLNPGGAINVGLKDLPAGTSSPKGVIALGGGNVFGYAREDFQVNTQRVFVVGQGDMNIWTTLGDIDSGRGANTAVAAPPLAARRSVDGVVYEVPATTTGSGLGILEDATGRRQGEIGLYPAFGEILALDAFIRAPVVRLGSSIKGADNIQAPSVSGAAAPVAAPVFAASLSNLSPTSAGQEPVDNTQAEKERARSSLLTVELLGLGTAESSNGERKEDDENCERAGLTGDEREQCLARKERRDGRR